MRITTALRLDSPLDHKPVITLSGAGGKSTLLFRLGDELAAGGRQVLLTTTTRMWARQIDQAPFSLVVSEPQLLARELPISLRGYGQVLALSGPAPGDKMRGLAPEVVCRLLALADVDAAVVEADGSRGRPLKAPAGHEPVVPACTTHLLVVASMAAVGKPLSEEWAHRPELVARLTGLPLGSVLTPAAIARLLNHPGGGLKGHPDRARAFLYLNLALGPELAAGKQQERLEAACQVAALVRQPRRAAARGFAAVLIGSAAAGPEPVSEVQGRVAGIVLAAGQSSRFGSDQPKQLLPWGAGTTLVGHVVDRALAAPTLDEVLVVVGYRAEEVAEAVTGRPVRVVVNEQWQTGQSSSVQAALGALPPDTQAAVFLLADQPDVRPATVDALVAAHRRTLAPIVAPLYEGGQWGNPVLFDRATFPELLALQGDVGGRPLIGRYGEAVHYVAVPGPRPQGIETPADLLQRPFAPGEQLCRQD